MSRSLPPRSTGREDFGHDYAERLLERFADLPDRDLMCSVIAVTARAIVRTAAGEREGVREVDVISPGFAADCIETLEEIAIRYREDFVAAGGGSLRYIPALNERRDHIEFLVALISEQLQGWRDEETESGPRAPDEERNPGQRDERGTLKELHR